MLHRERPEKEYEYAFTSSSECIFNFNLCSPIYQKYGTGTTVWSGLAGGLLTGKVCDMILRMRMSNYLNKRQYNDGIPDGSRFATQSFMKNTVKSLQQKEGQEQIRKVRELSKLAEQGGLSQLCYFRPLSRLTDKV